MRLLAAICVVLIAPPLRVGATDVGYRIETPRTDADGIPMSAARLCIGFSSSTVCYTPPALNPPFGLHPEAEGITLSDGSRLVLFRAESWAGGSGSVTHFALLDSRSGNLLNLLPDIRLSNQSELRIWKSPAKSSMPLVVTAEYIWAEGETHFSRHRYRITTYSYDDADGRYVERDKYVTERKYPGLDEADSITVLEVEKTTVLGRLQSKAVHR
jgi:hypothetical protein